MSVYVDSSAFLAVANSQDRQHEPAVRTWQGLVDRQEQVLTTNYVAVEAATLIHSRHGIPALRRFAEDLLSAVLVGFEIIRKSKVDRVFAYDRHFEGRGFELIGR